MTGTDPSDVGRCPDGEPDRSDGKSTNSSLKGSAGSTLWDKVAQENFHLLLEIQLDGVVQSAPLIQPSQSGFTSFDGQGTISGGNMTENDAKVLAQAMEFSYPAGPPQGS